MFARRSIGSEKSSTTAPPASTVCDPYWWSWSSTRKRSRPSAVAVPQPKSIAPPMPRLPASKRVTTRSWLLAQNLHSAPLSSSHEAGGRDAGVRQGGVGDPRGARARRLPARGARRAPAAAHRAGAPVPVDVRRRRLVRPRVRGRGERPAAAAVGGRRAGRGARGSHAHRAGADPRARGAAPSSTSSATPSGWRASVRARCADLVGQCGGRRSANAVSA